MLTGTLETVWTKVPQEFRPGWHDTAWEAVNVAYNGVPPPVFATTNLEVTRPTAADEEIFLKGTVRTAIIAIDSPAMGPLAEYNKNCNALNTSVTTRILVGDFLLQSSDVFEAHWLHKLCYTALHGLGRLSSRTVMCCLWKHGGACYPQAARENHHQALCSLPCGGHGTSC